jgi:hypothetical protein
MTGRFRHVDRIQGRSIRIRGWASSVIPSCAVPHDVGASLERRPLGGENVAILYTTRRPRWLVLLLALVIGLIGLILLPGGGHHFMETPLRDALIAYALP